MDNKLSMLIADDMSINRTLLRNIFSDEYDIYEAENGQEVMDIIRREEIDILLLDICMPVMDGMEVLQELNKDSRFSKITVIVNTVVNDPIKEIQALGLGADDYIVKPYNPQVMKRRVSNLVSKYVLKRKELAKDLESKSEQLSMLVDMMPGGIGALERDSTIRCTYYNEGLCRLLGYDMEEFEEQAASHMETVVYEKDIDKFRQFMKTDTRGQEPIHCTLRFVKKDGSILWLGLSARKESGKYRHSSYYTVFTDLTEEKNDMQKLQDQVEKDLLTGIYNRRTFYKKTKQLIKNHPKEKYVIVQWNIDRFKVINALYGSQCGDEVLIACARLLHKYIGKHGICGRLEADHFVAVITMDYVSSTLPSMERVLSMGIEMDQVDYPIMMHAGFYEVLDSTQSIDVMCDCANLALQEVKKNYLKRWEFFNEGMQQNLMNEQTLINEMEQALNLGQFIIRLQPIYDASTHEIASAEALVRWQHPQKGLISPGVFIPLFEKNGFITKLDMFIWEEVCRLLSENERAGRKNVPISVNVSRINFYNPDLITEIEAITKKYEIDHSMLKFEVTESAYMENPQQLIHEMEKIKEQGFSLLMDDFGSGYSSLNTLKDVPVDILKIDMMFLDHLENSPKATSILYSIIKMAQGLEISVVVEGVETKNQYEMLKSMGCEYIQGYYFSRPLSIVEFQKHLENGRIKRNVPKTDVKKTILVVDDIKLNRASIAANIAEDYLVLEAENGEEALKILKINPMGISLVVTDILMPVMDGFELLENIQKHHLYSRIPVLVLTAFDEGEKEVKAISLGAQDVITRPYDPSLLKQRIHNLLKISENEIIQTEIHSLRENFVIKRQLEDIIHDGVADFCNMKLNKTSGDYKLTSLEYANEGYFQIHGIDKQDGLCLGSMKGIFENIIASQQEEVINSLADAFKKKAQYIQNIYDIEKDGRVITVVSTGQIRYEKNNGITLALLEVPIWSKEKLIQKHLFGNIIF